MRHVEGTRKAPADWSARAVVAGFCGAVAMLFALLLAYGFAVVAARASLPEPLRGWLFALTHNPLTDLAGDNLYVVAGAHFLLAIGLALVYARFVEPVMGGPGWVRGVVFALIPWLASILVVLPVGGGGIAGLAIGAGPLPLLGNLILNLTYGAVLGATYGPLGEAPADSWLGDGPADAPSTVHRREARTVRWTAIGAAIGLAAALVAVQLDLGSHAIRLGVPPAAVILSWVLFGGAVGSFVGSLAGAAPTESSTEPHGSVPASHRPIPAEPRDARLAGKRDLHAGAKVGALLGTVAMGPIGLPLGAAVGGVADALRHDPPAFPPHTHDTRFSPCYDGCPAWRPTDAPPSRSV